MTGRIGRCDNLQTLLQDPSLNAVNMRRLQSCPMTDEERQAFEARLTQVQLAASTEYARRSAAIRNPRKLAFWFGAGGGDIPRIYLVLFLAGLGYGTYWIARFITRRT